MDLLLICLSTSSSLFTWWFKLSDRRVGSSMSGYRKDEYSWRYDGNELPEDVMRTSAALENLQLDRKARNLTSSWRYVLISKNYLLLCVCIWFLSLSEENYDCLIVYIFVLFFLSSRIFKMTAYLIETQCTTLNGNWRIYKEFRTN